MYSDSLTKKISLYLGGNTDVLYYYKGRVALFALLKAMGIKEGDEVIIPALTCVVVPNAIIYHGAKPIYVEVDKKTFNININSLRDAITSKTKVIICQNTFGLSSNVESIIDVANEHSLYTIEDCTHGFGGTYNAKPNGSYCDAAFYSMQWNKPFSSGVGGFAVVNNPKLVEGMIAQESEKLPVSFSEKMNLRLLYFVRRYILKNATYFFLVRMYRWMSKKGLVVGSSSGTEITSVEKPKDFFKAYSNVQTREAMRSIRNLDEVLVRRKQNAERFSEVLKELGKNRVSEDLFSNHSFLKYPLLVKNRDLFFEKAEKAKIPMGDWFNSPLHPVQQNFLPWHLTPENFPVAVECSAKLVNLPSDTKNANKVIRFLKENADLIEDQN